MRKIDRILKSIDGLSLSIGKFAGFLIPVLAGVVLFEVCMRYIFSASQSWTFEMSQFLFGTTFVLGGAYTFYHKAHVNVDVLYGRLSPKGKAIMDLITSIFILIFLGVLIWKGWEVAWRSFLLGERTESGWAPPIWPIRMLIPIGAFIMLLQGVANILRQTISVLWSGHSK